MEKIYLYKTHTKSIAYDSKQWYHNGVAQKSDEAGIDAATTAQEAAYKEMANDLSHYLIHFRNLAVLTAAGTSMDNGDNSGKTRTELWEDCKSEIDSITKYITTAYENQKDKLNSLNKEQNIENFLSFVILYEKLNGVILDDNKTSIRERLEKKIADACTLTLDETNTHHQEFIRKLTARKPSEPRVQLFTTNYDTLFEQAAKRMNYTIIDGFSFSYPRVFNGINFDYDVVYREHTRIKQEENYIPNVLQLFKLHGSIDWEKGTDDKIYQKEKSDKPCVIYPASEKYESSYEQPYSEMMAHLQQTLRKESTLLIIAGFGFQDKHIQNIIKESALQNANLHILIVCYGKKTEQDKDGNPILLDSGIIPSLVPDYIDEKLKVMPNISILFSKFQSFVEKFPMNASYHDNTDLSNATI